MGTLNRIISSLVDGEYFAAAMEVPLSQDTQARIFNRGSNIHKSKLYREDDLWRFEYRGYEDIYIPRPDDAVRFTKRGGYGKVYAKYLAHPEVSVRPNTTVIDIGAYLGEFSMALPSSCHVIAVEPDARSVACLRRNVGENAEVVHAAAWNGTTTLELELGEDGSESSVFGADDNRSRGRVEVDAVEVSDLVDGPVELLKVEAEGSEPEALEGALDLMPRQVVVDISEEREGKDTEDIIVEMLEERGYSVTVRGIVAIGVHSPDS